MQYNVTLFSIKKPVQIARKNRAMPQLMRYNAACIHSEADRERHGYGYSTFILDGYHIGFSSADVEK